MEANWSNNGNLNTHVWWHMAGFHFQLGEYEQALTLFDDTIKPLAVRCKCKKKNPFSPPKKVEMALKLIILLSVAAKMSFPMSDATALLLRLEMFGKPAGTSYQERWRELGNVCVELCDSINNVFYDFHALVATLFGDKRAAAMKLQANINEQSDEFDRGESKDYNFMVAKKVGNDIAKATIAFADEVCKIRAVFSGNKRNHGESSTSPFF